MLINGERELCYVVKVNQVEPIEGYDKVEKAWVNGWTVLVRKNQFKPNDLAIYLEIDSKTPETEPFKFLEQKHYKVKSQKFCKGTVLSQGLLMSFEDFPNIFFQDLATLNDLSWCYKKGIVNEYPATEVKEGDPLTKILNISYAIAADNKRKSTNNKYSGMVQRHQKLFKENKIVKWLYKRKWGKELLFIFLGKKSDNKRAFPKHFPYIHVTDEERVENLVPGILEDKREWIQTLKIDGTSTTFILERKPFGRFEFYVVSRNVRQLTPDQANWHSKDGDNVYWEMAYKYNIEEKLKDMLTDHPDWKYVGLQGETAGPGVQGNPHKLNEVKFYGFNLIDSETGRWNSVYAQEYMKLYGIEWVPIINTKYILPNTIEELKAQADEGEIELNGGSGLREGYVYRSQDGKESFKNVSNKFLLSKGE